jgi:hypothetical protein
MPRSAGPFPHRWLVRFRGSRTSARSTTRIRGRPQRPAVRQQQVRLGHDPGRELASNEWSRWAALRPHRHHCPESGGHPTTAGGSARSSTAGRQRRRGHRLSEITVDTAVYVGYSQPRGEVTLFTGLELFNRAPFPGQPRLQVRQLPVERDQRIRCESRLNCRGTADLTAPVEGRLGRGGPAAYQQDPVWIYGEDRLLRFRELSATWTMPMDGPVDPGRVGVPTVAGRNLGLLTDYSGMDGGRYFGTNIGTRAISRRRLRRATTFRLNLTF